MLELLRHPTPELPCTLEESELSTRLGDDGVAAAPHTGVDVRARGAVCALGDDGAAAAPHTGADACARGAVYALGDAGAAAAPTPELPCTLEDAIAVRAWEYGSYFGVPIPEQSHMPYDGVAMFAQC